MDQKLDGWFTERSSMWPGQALSLKVKHELFHKRSKYQDIRIFESENHGRVLTLDDVIQCTEYDEASYQEMITFLPLCSHPNPRKVLIIGGGDGGVAREVAKHPQVEEIVQCEIDEEVVNACRTHLPSMGQGFSSSKLHLLTGDGADFVVQTNEKFNVIITDASDPVVGSEDESRNGPASSLFDENYYKTMQSRLTDDGIMCCQGESMWLHADLIGELLSHCRKIYPVVEYAYSCTPTYPSGQIGFILCSNNKEANLREPVCSWNKEELKKLNLNYYNLQIHRASFIMPNFMEKILQESYKK